MLLTITKSGVADSQHNCQQGEKLRAFLEGKTGPADPGHRLAAYLLDYVAGKRSDEQMVRYWDRSFPETNG